MFGFRILDADNKLFWEEDIINWQVLTETKSWNNATSAYDTVPTYYRLSNCLDYYKSDLNGTIALEESAFIRADINSYLCPVALLPKFIQGTQFEESYVSTTLQLDVCQADGVKVCADETVVSKKVDEL